MIGPTFLLAALAAPASVCPPPPPSGMTARAASFGGAIAFTARDAEEAAAAGDLARTAARRYLGLEAPAFLIFAGPTEAVPATDCAFVFPWQFARGAGGEMRLPSHVLPHEIGHVLFIRYMFPESGRDEYGGAAPDWLDEMAAMAFEDGGGVAMRREEVRRQAGRGALIPLARLLTMPHPEWTARRPVPGASEGPPVSQPGSAETPAYYATVRALFDFLIDRTGDEQVIARLAQQVRAGAPLDAWLLAQTGKEGAAAGLTGLDAQLAAFVLAPEYGPVRTIAAPENSS